MFQRFAFAAVVVIAAIGGGCATSTMIVTDPPGATVARDGQTLGTTPLRYESKMWVLETEHIQVTSTSGVTQDVALTRSEIDALPFVGSLGLVACFWYSGIGLVGIPWYFAAAWKLPATTVVTHPARPARKRDDEVGDVVAALERAEAVRY
jgi:hypothetical protein